MDFEEYFDPLQPYGDELATIVTLLRNDATDEDAVRLIRLMQFGLPGMYSAYRETCDGKAHPDQISALRGFLDHAMRLSSAAPSRAELDVAPELCRWSPVLRDGIPILIGVAIGHPLMKWGARATTSPYFQINLKAGWARTWSRFYLLSEYDPSFLLELQYEGAVSRNIEPIRLR